MAGKKAANIIEKWRRKTKTGIKYGVHVISGNNKKVIDTPGQLFKSRSSRRDWIAKKKAEYGDMEEVKIK